MLVYKSEPRVRRVVPSLDGDNPESDGNGGTELDDSINSSTMSKNINSDKMSTDASVQTKSAHKKKSRSKPKGLTIDIPSTNVTDKSQMSTVDEQTDEVDFHEYVNLVDCQRYREEMSRSTNVIGSNPVLHFPNVIGYASTQHILALYGNPRTPLLPDHYGQQQHGVAGGNGTPHQPLQSKLSGLLSPTERYTKTLSNGDLRGNHHHHIVSSTQNLVPKFGSHHHQHAFRNHHQVRNKSINDVTL